jgi:hypothetical protein
VFWVFVTQDFMRFTEGALGGETKTAQRHQKELDAAAFGRNKLP